MATCSLNPEALKALNIKVIKDLKELAKTEEAFDLKSYSNTIYDYIYSATNDHALALDATRIVPLFVARLAINNKKVRKVVGAKAIEYADLTDDLLSKDLEETEKFLGLKEGQDLKDTLKALNQDPDPDPNEEEDLSKVKFTIKDKFVGKVIYATPGSGKSFFTERADDLNIIDADIIKIQVIQDTEWGKENPYKDDEKPQDYIKRFTFTSFGKTNRQLINNSTMQKLREYANKGFTVLTGTKEFIKYADFAFIVDNDNVTERLGENKKKFKKRELELAKETRIAKVITTEDTIIDLIADRVEETEDLSKVEPIDVKPLTPVFTDVAQIEDIEEALNVASAEKLVPSLLSTVPNEVLKNVDTKSYKVQRMLLDLFSYTSAENMSELPLTWETGSPVAGVYIRLMKSSDVNTKDDIDLEKNPYLYVITDRYGDPIKFDDNLKPNLNNGDVAYFKVSSSKVSYAAAENLAKRTGLKLAEAKEVIKREAEQLEKVKEYLETTENPQNILYNVTGGSKGFILVAKAKKERLKLNDPSLINKPGVELQIGANLTADQIVDKTIFPGETYYTHDGLGGVYFRVRMPELRDTKYSNVVYNLLIQKDITDVNGKPITPSARKKYIQQFIAGTKKTKKSPDGRELVTIYGLYFTVDKNAPLGYKLYIKDFFNKNNGNPILIDPSTVEGKARLRNYLSGSLDIKIARASVNFSPKQYSDNKNLFTIEEADGKFKIVQTEDSYVDFIHDNFTVEMSKENGEIEPKNSYFTLSLADSTINTIYDVEEVDTEATVEENDDVKDYLNNLPEDSNDTTDIADDELMKNVDVANRSKKATQEQIAEAERWWNSDANPLNKYIPFKAMFDLVNSNNPSAVATWSISGITLFKGSDFSDIYHEAWHGFTQTFMTRKEKSDLYKEVRKKSGTFLDHKNVRVRFEDATNLQIEEYLAEEFRNYMLKGQKAKKNSPKQNSFFRKIWNILKSLFGDSRYSEIITDDTIDNKLNTIFEKLRVGDIKEYSFDIENASFDELNKGISSTIKDTEVKELNLQESLDVVNVVDYYINEWITSVNSEFTPDDIKRYRELVNKKEKNQTENAELTALSAAKKYVGVARLINDPVKAYVHAYKGILSLKEDLEEQFNKESNEALKNQLAKKIQTLTWALNNFGNLKEFNKNKPSENRFPAGVIAYHLSKTKLFKDTYKDIDFENIGEDELYTNNQRSGIDRKGNESSLVEDTKPEIIWMLQSLIDPVKTNKFGLPEKSSYKETIVKIIRATENTQDYNLWAKAFNELAAKDPIVNQIISKLGNPLDVENALPANTNMWSNLWNAFNKSRVPLVQVTNTVASEGLSRTTVGVALSENNSVMQSWETDFSAGRSENQKYIYYDKEGALLDINKLLNDFKSLRDVQRNPYAFLTALGINVSDIPELRKELTNVRLYNISAYYNNLVAISKLKNVNNVRSIKHIINPAASFTETTAAERLTFTDISGYYGNLASLEQDYSYKFTNFSRVNAEGNVMYEHSLNNYLTTTVNAINNAQTLEELFNDPKMQHLNPEINPFAKYSVWLNSVFDFKTGKKRFKRDGTPVKLYMYNLSGSLFQDQLGNNIEGRAAAKSDQLSKISLDINLMLQGFPELPRHADKSTSYGVKVDGPLIYPNNSANNSFNLIDAVKSTEEINEILIERMQGVLFAELTRMQKFTKLNLKEQDLFDYNYLEEGKNFHYFDDIIGNSTDLGKAIKTELEKDVDIIEAVQNNTDGIKDRINTSIIKYFDHLLKKDSVTPDQYYLSDEIKQKINKFLPTKQKNDENIINDIVNKVYVYGTYLNNIESTLLLYGDIALYNHAKQELHKRNAGAGSTGTIYRTDEVIAKVIDNLNAKNSYAKELGVDPSVNAFSGSMKTAIMEDNKVGSIYFTALEKTLGKKDAADYGAGKQNEADAQGLIGIDAYRALKLSQGTWSNEHQAIYNKAIKGEVTPAEIKNFFPVIKGQYWGPIQSENANIMAFHKYSLFPLIPSVIKDTNAEIVHKRMTREGIGYITFQSGSKVGNITRKEGFDKLYKDKENKILVDEIKSDDVSKPYFTPNVIRLEYLKDQLYIHDKDKGKTIFPTQLRKLAEDGLFEEGVPTDFMPNETDSEKRILAWEKVEDKEAASANFKLAKHYEGLIKQLSALHKKRLLEQIGWDGKGVIDNAAKTKLIQIASRELERNDAGYERINALAKTSGDYSGLLDAETIDKTINSLIEKNLVKQNVTGEALVQVANTLMEKAVSPTDINFRKPTKEDYEKYNAKSLPFYQQQFDDKGNPLPTSAMKVKVALRGKFKNLLNFEDLDGNRIGTIEKLNELIRNEEWLNKDNNRNAITMIGVRIPVQGVNSMEVMEVFEFLEESAGNVIIPPTEIVTKSGADFDVDKMTIMMPNLASKVEKLTKENLELLQALNPELNFSKDNVETVLQMIKEDQPLWLVSEELEAIGNAIIEFTRPEGQYVVNNEISGVENSLIEAMRAIILRPDNFKSLVTPNSTDIFEKAVDQSGLTIVQEAGEYNMTGYNFNNTNIKGQRENTSGKKMISPTITMEPGYNLAKHQYNKVGKEVLGLGAVDNTYNVLTNRIGLIMTEANMTFDEYSKLQAEFDKTVALYESNPKANKKLKKVIEALDDKLVSYRKHNLRLSHNKSGNKISLSKTFAQDGTKISEVVSQLINGWVDVAKEAWVFDVQGNKELASPLLFMVQAGVPIRQAVLFLSNPLIQQYAIMQRRFSSPASIAIDDTYAGTYYRSNARKAVMGLVSNVNIETPPKEVIREREEFLNQYGDEEFTLDKIRENLKKWKDSGEDYTYTDFDKAVFYHFLQIEEMATEVTKLKMATNVDTSKDGTSVEVRERLAKINDLSENVFTINTVEKLKDESPIGSFFNTGFQLNILENVLSFRNHKAIFKAIQALSENKELKQLYPDKAKRVKAILNDLNNFVFQNELKYFSVNNLSSHRGFGIKINDKKLTIQESARGTSLQPVTIDTKSGVINVNLIELKRIFESDTHLKDTALASKLQIGTISTFDEYVNFVIEREIYKTQNTLEELKESTRFKNDLEYSLKNSNRLGDESDNNFKTRVINRVYENYVRDAALKNIFNYQALFYGKTSFAGEFVSIFSNFKKLQELEIYNQIKLNKDGKSSKRLNLKMIDSKADGDMINVLNENIKTLSSPAKLKELIPEVSDRDRKEISKFFKNFALYAFMQSGWSSKGSYAINKLGNHTKIKALMAQPINKLKTIFDEVVSENEASQQFLNTYLDKFIKLFIKNRTKIGGEKGINYFINTSVTDKASVKPTVAETETAGRYIFDPVEVEAPVSNTNEIKVVSEPYGVVTVETNPSKSLTQRFIDLIKPQIQNQAYKENNSGAANDMFSFGLRWTRKSKAKKPIVNRSFANGGKATTDALAKDGYVYDTLDQNGKPLAPISDLQPIIEHIQNSLGIDMSNYDAVLGNIYLPGQSISTHRDTTESESARNYPVIVYTIGNTSGINIHESSKPGAISFASDPVKAIPTKDGTIYTFGLDGKGRFEVAHDTPRNMKRDVEQPPITLPNGDVITNYTITLTFRRAADLTQGMVKSPTKISTTQTITPVANIPQNKVSGVESYGSTVTAAPNVIEALGKKPHSIDMIEAGFRTRTTRSASEMSKYNVKVGDVIKHFGKSADGTTKEVLARVTAIHPKGTSGWKSTWSKEGWSEQDVKVIDKFKDGAAAIEFEVIKPTKPTVQPIGEVKEGVQELFESNPELSDIGTQELYSQYLDTIFPNSEVKDIIYHGSPNTFEIFNKLAEEIITSTEAYADHYFFTSSRQVAQEYVDQSTPRGEMYKGTEKLYSVLINAKNLKKIDFEGASWKGDFYEVRDLRKPNSRPKRFAYEQDATDYTKYDPNRYEITKKSISELNTDEFSEQAKKEGYDSSVVENVQELNSVADTYAVFNPEQIHILGSKQDIERFKEFVQRTQPTAEGVQNSSFANPKEIAKSSDAIRTATVRQSKRFSMKGLSPLLSELKNENSVIIVEGTRNVDAQGNVTYSNPSPLITADRMPNIIYLPSLNLPEVEGVPDSKVLEEIQQAIESIKDAVQTDKTLYWDINGYGIKDGKIQIGGKSYVSLSKELFDNFAFINPLYLNSKTYSESVNEFSESKPLMEVKQERKTEIEKFYSDSEVEEFMKNCM